MEGGLWGLVTIASAFFIQVFAFGASAAIGVYNVEFLDYFDNDSVGVSLIASINLAVFLGAGPFASFLMTKMSYRKIALIGSALVVLGIFLMPLLPYIPALCVCFGLLTGLGSCLVYIPSHVLSGLYYDRHRSLATGIATSGSGLGGAIMPLVAGYLIQHFGWKGSLTVLAGIKLHLFVCAAVLRSPLKPVDKPLVSKTEAEALLTNVDGAADKNEAATGTVVSENTEMVLDSNTEALRSRHASLTNGDVLRNENCSTNGHVRKQSGKTEAQLDPKEENLSEQEVKVEEKKVLRHIYLFTDVGFTVYFISNFFWNITGALIMAFGAEFVTERGLDPIDAAWVASTAGFGCFIGGLLGGVLGNLLQHRRVMLYAFANVFLGLFTAAVPFGSGYNDFAGLLFSADLGFGVVLGLLMIVLTDLIGPQSLGDGMGYLMLSNGLGCFVGPPLAGYLRHVTGSYDAAFYIGGAFAIAAGVIMVLISLIRSCCAKKKNVPSVYELEITVNT